MSSLEKYLQEHSSQRKPLSLAIARQAAEQFDTSLLDVECAALSQNIMPYRFTRNNLSCAQQLKLHTSSVAIIGCGGLGGTIAELCARLGVGSITLVDPDVFEEHNLNRQRFSTVENLGKPKAQVVASQLATINPACNVSSFTDVFREHHLDGQHGVLDGLDDGVKRGELAAFCAQKNVPLFHGAVREWYAQATTVLPGDDILSLLYPPHHQQHETPQVLAPTVVLTATIQVTEMCKYLADLDSSLTAGWLNADLLNFTFDFIPTS